MAWLAGYGYRKSITLSRASGAVTNYQMKLLLGESSGATGEDVDCGGYCLSTFNDLRFTKADGTTLLDYWIESISGTTPNQLATIWIEFDSIGTGATTFYMYYGKSDAAAVSSGADTFIYFDDFERGNDGDTVGGSWTELVPHCHISTEQKYGGTRSAKLIGQVDYHAAMQYTLAPSENQSIMLRFYKETAAELFPLYHGNGTKRVFLYINSTEDLKYFAGTTETDSGQNISADAWQSIEVNNFNWTAYTFDLWLNGVKIVTGAAMNDSANASGVVWCIGDNTAVNKDSWIDNFIVRNYRATEPSWGAWGTAEEYFEGIVSETATATDEATAYLLSDSTSETATVTDAMDRSIDITVTNSETATATDSIVPDHLVDVTSDTATVTDLVEPDDLIRKKVKFPNTQAKHISLKFTSATSGSFAIYYLRHKMYKTRELCSDQKHPNTQGSHIGIKLSNSGSDEFILMYVSEKMQLVTT